MVKVQVIVWGLAILCLNNRLKQGEFGILEGAPDHEFMISMYEIDPLTGTSGSEETIYPVPEGEIRFTVERPEISGIEKDDAEINRLEGPTVANRQSLRWLLDLEGSELHARRVGRNPNRPTSFGLRKIIVPNGYFYTAQVRDDNGYLIKKPDGRVTRFGKIGHMAGAMIYADRVTLNIGPDEVFDVDDDSYYQIIITNLEKDNNHSSDFSHYYTAIQTDANERFSFLSAPLFKPLLKPDGCPEDEEQQEQQEQQEQKAPKTDGVDEKDAKDLIREKILEYNILDMGVHYECWCVRCSNTESIDEIA